MAELERTPEPASSWRGWAARGTASSIPGSNSAPRRVKLEPIPTAEVQRSAVGQQKVTDPGITGKKRTPGECRGPQQLQAISLWRGSADGQSRLRLGVVEIGLVFDPTRVHQTRREQGKCSRQHQLRVDAHELRDPCGRLPGLVQVVHHWIQHFRPPFRAPKVGVPRHMLTTIRQEQFQLQRHILETTPNRLPTPPDPLNRHEVRPFRRNESETTDPAGRDVEGDPQKGNSATGVRHRRVTSSLTWGRIYYQG